MKLIVKQWLDAAMARGHNGEGQPMTDMVEEALEFGRKNNEMMELGKAWCTHIRARRVGGVGLVEQTSGLPVTWAEDPESRHMGGAAERSQRE